MIYLVTIFIPPVYFLLRKRWGEFILNGFFYLSSFPLLFFAGFGVIIWVFCVSHAGWYLRKELMEEHAEMIATKMAEKITVSKSSGDPPFPPKPSQSSYIREPEPPENTICPNCSANNPDRSSFCGHCGARLK